MFDVLLYLVGFLFVAAIVIVAFVLPLIAIAQIRGLDHRLVSLKREIRELWEAMPPPEKRPSDLGRHPPLPICAWRNTPRKRRLLPSWPPAWKAWREPLPSFRRHRRTNRRP